MITRKLVKAALGKLIAILALAWLAAPAQAQQPWEGIWMRSELPCDDATAIEMAVRISRTEVEGAPFLCRILDIRGSGKPSWVLTLRCTEGGPSENVVHALSLTKTGNLIRRGKGGAQEELARCTRISEATRNAILERRKFMACEGPGCKVTAVEWNNFDTAIAWAVGRPSADDADHTCHAERGLQKGSAASQACVKEQLAKPPVKISANCQEGSLTASGKSHMLTDAAREGALPHSEMAGYWVTTPPHSIPAPATTAMMATWFRLLCPTESVEWNMKPAN